MTILWRCLLWLERLLLLLLRYYCCYYCGTTAAATAVLLRQVVEMCEDGDGCRRLPLLRALGQAPPLLTMAHLLWLYLPWLYLLYARPGAATTYYGYTCSTCYAYCRCTVAVLSLYRRCTMAMPTMAILWLYYGYTMAIYGYTVAVCLPRAWPLPGASRRWAGVRWRLRQLCDRGARGDGGEAAAR